MLLRYRPTFFPQPTRPMWPDSCLCLPVGAGNTTSNARPALNLHQALLILRIDLGGRRYYYPHFIGEGSEAQKSQVTCPMIHSGEELGLGFEPRQLPLGDSALNDSLPLSYSHMVPSLHRLLWVLFPCLACFPAFPPTSPPPDFPSSFSSSSNALSSGKLLVSEPPEPRGPSLLSSALQ